jgi:hypothetical protein
MPPLSYHGLKKRLTFNETVEQITEDKYLNKVKLPDRTATDIFESHDLF